jgi:hypothetical protein
MDNLRPGSGEGVVDDDHGGFVGDRNYGFYGEGSGVFSEIYFVLEF